MAKIANVAATDTFSTWRTRSNQAFDRLSQFAINNSSLYANTLTANVSLVVSGSLIANGSAGTAGLALKTNGSGVYWGQVSSNQNTYERSLFLATSGQTTFSATYSVGFVEVYQNGVKLISGTDYTASNGTTVVLSVGATLNDNIEILAFNTFSVANVVTQSTLNSSLALKANAANPVTTGRLNHSGLAVTTNLKITGNTYLGNTGKVIVSTGELTHTGTASVSTNLTVSGNASISGLKANGSLGSSGNFLKTNGTSIYWDPVTYATKAYAAANSYVKTVLANTNSYIATKANSNNATITGATITGYTESVVAIGTVTTSHTLAITAGTVLTATLTASTACTFTMPTATAGKSFTLLLKQAASTGSGTATFTGVKWSSAGAPTITATAGKMDILTFVSDGTNWYGTYVQGYTP